MVKTKRMQADQGGGGSVVVDESSEERMSDSGGNVPNSGVGEKERHELEKLKLEIELGKIRLELARVVPVVGARMSGEVSIYAEYARELKAVLAPMPDSDPMVPAWFKNVDTLFAQLGTPESVQGTIILPYLNVRMRAFVANQSGDGGLTYKDLKECVLKQLRMTANEYKRLFMSAQKGESEPWSQFVSQIETLFSYYINSRGISTLDDMKDLIIADRLKQVMSDDLRTYILQNEIKNWLRPTELAELAENFEESYRSRRRQDREKRVERDTGKATVDVYKGARPKTARVDRWKSGGSTNLMTCFSCGKVGHRRLNCPELQRKGDVTQVATERRESKLVAKASLLCNARDTQAEEILQEKSGLTYINLVIGKSPLRACLDSGADITVVRLDSLPEGCAGESRGKVKLRGAFGHTVSADLMYVPLGLAGEEGAVNQQVSTLCAVTNELAPGLGALLTPEAHGEISRVRRELEEDALGLSQKEEDVSKEWAAACTPIEVEGVDFERESNEELTMVHVNSVDVEMNEHDVPVGDPGFLKEQREDATLSDAWDQGKAGTHGMIIEHALLFHREQLEDGKICRQLVLPRSRRDEVLKLAHDMPCGGHFSEKKTKQRIKGAFFWPTMTTDVKAYCQSCHTCQVFSRRKTTDRVPITPLTRPEQPFQVVYVDVIGPLEPASARGHRYALSVVDLCTRWADVIPLRSLTAKATCQALLEVFTRFGTPEMICCDQGTNFASKLTTELAECLGITMRFSTPEHPQSNGIVERWNGTFKAMLRHVVDAHDRDWDRYIPCLLWAYREVPHGITGVSPFELMYGRQPLGPLCILQKTWTGEWTPPTGLNKPAAEYLLNLRERMSKAALVVDDRSCAMQEAYANKYNLRAKKKEFKVGDQVLVCETGLVGKLQPKWVGPGIVKEKKREDSYIIQLPDGNKWVHANRLRPYVVRANNVGVIFETDDDFGEVWSLPCDKGKDRVFCKAVDANTQLTRAQGLELDDVVKEFGEIFSDEPGRCKVGSHSIRIQQGAKPAKSYPYKVPMALRDEVDRQVTQLLEWDFIYPVDSAFAHPVVCVAKKDGSVRMCVDYRQLNAITESDSFPMGNVAELLYSVANARYISLLDMTRGYWQIALDPSSRKYTAFATPRGLYAWRVMPYGLKNSAATFQRVMNEVLKEHVQYVCTYIDDVAVYSQTWDEHICHLRGVLTTLAEVGLTVNPEKCKFAQPRVKYLGHVVGSGTHSPDPERVAAIMELSPPETKRDIRSVLGMFNYYRDYIPEYSRLVLPLTALTNKRIPNRIPWNEAADESFSRVKEALCSVPELAAPDYKKEFTVTTDASEYAVGACLSQTIEGTERPIAFLSKKLTASQIKWSAIEREAYAIVWALGRLDTWIFGRKVKVVTDHNPLTFLTRSTSSSARLTRWSLALQKYDIEIVHIRGSLNHCADALSRLARKTTP